MKTLITLTFLTLSLNAHAELNIKKQLQAQANKELNGKASSCFKGLVAKKNSDMEENYGGRYQAAVEVQVIDAGSSTYRAPAKYCFEGQNDQRVCDNSDTNEYIASALFSSSTSGTYEVEAIVFKVKVEQRNILVIKEDASDFPEQQDVISQKTITTIRCAPLNP